MSATSTGNVIHLAAAQDLSPQFCPFTTELLHGDFAAAILIRQLHFWISLPNGGQWINGRHFIWKSSREWQRELFFHMTPSGVRRIVKRCRDAGYIETRARPGESDLFSLRYKALRAAFHKESIPLPPWMPSTEGTQLSAQVEIDALEAASTPCDSSHTPCDSSHTPCDSSHTPSDSSHTPSLTEITIDNSQISLASSPLAELKENSAMREETIAAIRPFLERLAERYSDRFERIDPAETTWRSLWDSVGYFADTSGKSIHPGHADAIFDTIDDRPKEKPMGLVTSLVRKRMKYALDGYIDLATPPREPLRRQRARHVAGLDVSQRGRNGDGRASRPARF